MITYTSPLDSWPGDFSLPDFDDFTGDQWDTWRNAFENAPQDTLNRQFCYAGLIIIEKFGKWNMAIDLVDVKAWRQHPENERMRLVGWLGKRISDYMTELINPKG